MRCPKCSETFLVEKPGEGAATASSRRGEATMVGGAGGRGPSKPAAPDRRGQATAAAGSMPELDAFGELDFNLPVDNPRTTAVQGGFDDDLPDLPGSGSPEAGRSAFDDLPAPTRDRDDGFDDLPMPSGGGRSFDDDLPMPSPGLDDLPAPAAGRGRFDDDLPAPRGRTRSFDDDLPAPARGRGGFDDDLPAPRRGGFDDDLPAPARGRGGFDDDLPAPRRGGFDDDLPAPRGGGFDDLPAPTGDDLPMALEADLPLALDDDLPVAGGEADLPLALDDDASLPLPADDGLPVPAIHGDLPLAGDHDLPLANEHGDLPLPSDQDFPLASEYGDLPEVGTSGDAAIPLGDDGGDLQATLESEPPRPRAGGAPASQEDVGGEFAIEQAPDEDSILDVEGDAPDAGGDAPKVKIKKRRGKRLRVALLVPIVLAVGGGLLGFTPLGPYGYNAITDALNADSYAAALDTLRQSARQELAADTHDGAQKLLGRAVNEQLSRPRHPATTAYTAYLGYATSLRFGSDAGREATAQQMLASLTPEQAAEEPLATLAKGAQLAVQGQLPAALGEAKRAESLLPNDVDAGVLVGEILLRTEGKTKEALAQWQTLVENHPSARTRYGLARAQRMANKSGEAIQAAEATVKESANHAGARVLIAEARFKQDRKSAEALKLLEEVTKKGSPVRASASKEELVLAFSLLGDAYLARSKTTAAEKAYAEAINLDPKSVRALVGNGELFFSAGRFSEALARFESASRVDGKNVGAVIGKAKTKLSLEKPKEAKQVLVAAMKWSKHPLVGYQLGRAHEALGEYEEAEKAYRAAIDNAPEHQDLVYPYVQLAELLTARGRTEEAAKVLTEATAALPNNPKLFLSKGVVALKSGRLEDAKRELEAALALEPENTFAMFELAVAHRRAREFAEAEQLLDKIKTLDPELPGLALERGRLYQASGKTEEALKMYNAALEKAPDDIDLKLRVSSTQVISGLPRKALPTLREVMGKRPQSAEVNHFLGRAMLAIGDAPQEALRYLENAVRFDPNKAEYHLYVAWAANELGRPGLAEESIDKALAIDQNMGDAYWQKGVVLQKNGQTRDALKLLEKAIELNPLRWEAYATMARCFADQVNYGKAEEAWRKAIEGKDDHPEWHFRLGKILFDRGNKVEAAKHLATAVDVSVERKQTPPWLWNANFLLGEAIRNSDGKRALKAYKEFLRLSGPENAYRTDAERAIATLEGG